MKQTRWFSGLGAAVVMAIATQAGAAPITFKGFGLSESINIMHNGHSSQEYAGQMQINVGSGPSAALLLAYCVDLDDGALNNWTATSQSVDVLDPPPGTGKRVGYLFDAFAGTVTTSIQAAALQVAMWELLDDFGGTIDVRAGNFKLIGNDSKTNSIAAQANTYLGSIPANVGTYNPTAYVLASDPMPRSQDLIVPEPGSLILLGLAIPSALLRRRRTAV